MDVSCEHCQARFRISDEKIPEDKTLSIPCPRCKENITIAPRSEPPPPAEEPVAQTQRTRTLMDEVASGSYSATDRPFDFVEEGAETALICESDPVDSKKIEAALLELGYQVTTPKNGREVLKQMRFHVFDLLLINEMFDARDPDQNNILKHLERMPMDTRRNMYVIMISNRFRTMDNMAAFNRSVNLIVNPSNIDEIQTIVKRAITENIAFYKVYKESMIKAGRG